MTGERELALEAKAWPFQEAKALLKRFEKAPPAKGYVLFETGYGPSGLPHIGTFGEVVRTTMVRQAFSLLSDIPTKLVAFSDDMDGLRKVPDNVPQQELLADYLDRPLTEVPDPFGTHDSFGAHNNARLQAFLDSFGFDYEFKSATAAYKSGEFDATLLTVLERYDAVIKVILPTLGEERRKTYSPFLPVCPDNGKVLQVPVIDRDVAAGTITYQRDDGEAVTTPVTGGRCKLQWKADWAMRWTALQVDYEMSGKDLIDSVRLSSAICRILGGTPPASLTYELFLDEKGEKISKSRGNGLAVEDWLRYAPAESLSLFMYQQPKRAKRLYFDAIPKAVDEYQTFVAKYADATAAEKLENPARHIHGGAPDVAPSPLSFGLLLNLASVVNADAPEVLWGFISRYAPGATPDNQPFLATLVTHALVYYQDFVKPGKSYRGPSAQERAALEDLLASLSALPRDTGDTGDAGDAGDSAAAADIQNQIYAVGKRHDFDNLRDWFKALYEILLGQEQGPRMGSFIALYGIDETCALIRTVLDKGTLSASTDPDMPG